MQERRVLLGPSIPGAVDGSKAVALDVVFSSNDGSELLIIHGQENWPDEGYTPIGIVVVPGTHNRYEDNSCGIMSLVEMYYYRPASGAMIFSSDLVDSTGMYWGYYTPRDGNVGYDSYIILVVKYADEYIPYQVASTGTECTIRDGNIIWPYAGTSTTPTPDASTEYSNANGYVTDTISGKAGCDFNGIRNTAYIYIYSGVEWNIYSVTNGYLEGQFPAAQCCGLYKTVGTNQFVDVFGNITTKDDSYGTPTSPKTNKGFWYLPALGELCYIPSKRFEFNKIILALNQKYGNVGTLLDQGAMYWSSTGYGHESYCVYPQIGQLRSESKFTDELRFTRAFMRL